MGLTESEIKENEKLWMEEKKIDLVIQHLMMRIFVPSEGNRRFGIRRD